MKKILLTLFVGLVIVACEKDEEVVNYDDVEIELRAKGGNKGKPDKPDDTPSGISYEYLDGLNAAPAVTINRVNKMAIVEEEIHIVGKAEASTGDSHAFLWTESGGWQDLGFLHEDYPNSSANDINSHGNIVGHSTSLEPIFHSSEAATWSINPIVGPSSINPLSSVNSSAKAINELGDIVGSRVDTCGYEGYGDCGPGSPGGTISIWSAFMWKKEPSGFSYIDIGTFGGHSRAYGVNDARVVVGEAEIGYNTEIEHAFRWSEDDGLTDLGTLGVIDGLWSKATAINNAGQIVGWSELDNGYIRGFIWTKTEGMVILPTLLGRTFIEDISENGHIVGNSMVSTGGNSNRGHPHAYLSPGGVNTADRIAIDLGTAGGNQSYAYAVTEKNGDPNIVYVVGRNYSRKSGYRAVLWTVDLSKL